MLAQTLLDSISHLAANMQPRDLLPPHSDQNLAHSLARRILPVSAPSIRGVLDPRRPKSLHENATVSMRPAADMSRSHATAQAGGPGPATPFNMAKPQAPPYQSYSSSTSPFRPTSGPPYSSSSNTAAVGNTIYGRTTLNATPTPSTAFTVRPNGPGPSNLRQSFGPGPIASPAAYRPASLNVGQMAFRQ